MPTRVDLAKMACSFFVDRCARWVDCEREFRRLVADEPLSRACGDATGRVAESYAAVVSFASDFGLWGTDAAPPRHGSHALPRPAWAAGLPAWSEYVARVEGAAS